MDPPDILCARFNGTAFVGGNWWLVIADPPLPQTSIPNSRLDFRSVGTLARLRNWRNPQNIRWAEGDIICKISRKKETWSWRELECMGIDVLSLTNLLRIGEAWTVSSPGDAAPTSIPPTCTVV